MFDFVIPHIMYISDPDGQRIGLWYLGDEPVNYIILIQDYTHHPKI